MSRVWGRHAPTRSLRKCRCIEEAKSRWSTTFSRIENLWPRDGSCSPPLRSKVLFGNCYGYVKMKNWARSQVKVLSAHVSGSPFAPNEVPALFCSGVGWKAGITFGRLMKFSRYCPRKRKMPLRSRRRILSG